VAKDPKQSSAPKIELDALAETMVPNPATIPDSVALAGFVGRSAEEGNLRLYVDPSFRNYYEIAMSDILHTQQLPATQSPLGGSVVYVKGGAPLRRVQVSTEIEARFLQGPMSTVGATAAGMSSLRGTNRAFVVTSTGARCRTEAHTSCSDACQIGGGGGGGGGDGVGDSDDCVHSLSFDYTC
jgi:hypothetical protein